VTNIDLSNNKTINSITPINYEVKTKSTNSSAVIKTSSNLLQPKIIVPQFYYPHGKPEEKQFKDDVDIMKMVNAEFRMQKDNKMYKEQFFDVVKLIGLPRYWKILLFRACTLVNNLNYVTYQTFEQVWTK
jgi:hypothetical protein